jgi:hypothetical protein
MRKQILHTVLFLTLGLSCLGLISLHPKTASAANPATIIFQGKVFDNTSGNVGINVPSSTYSIVFRIYNTASPVTTTTCTSTASCLWEETQASVTVTNGVFQVELGASCALTSSSCNNATGGPIPANWSSSSLYLTMKFNGDAAGFMSPTIHLMSVPFAFNSDNLGGLAAANFVQLAQGLQTDSSTTNASIAINKTGSTANILTLQKSSTSVMTIDNGGLINIQPAANLSASSSHVSQTLTNASSTGTTVNGYNQTITISNSSAGSTTNGINIAMTDNTALGNTDRAVNIKINSTNTAATITGLNSDVDRGLAINAVSRGTTTITVSCTGIVTTWSLGLCAGSTVTSGKGTGVAGGVVSQTAGLNGTGGFGNEGVLGANGATTTAANYAVGVRGITYGSGTAGTNIGVYGEGKAGSGATVYGGYFNLGAGGATAGAALYATNTTVAANILDLQDGTGSPTSVFTVGDGGLITATSNSSAGLVVKNSSTSKTVLSVDTSGDKVLLGQAGASGLDGTLIFNNSAGSNTVGFSLQANPVSSYTLLLPTTGPSTSQCLQTDPTTANQLKFASCSGGGTTLQIAYDSSSGGSTPEIVLGLNAGDTSAVDIQNKAGAAITGASLFAVRDKAANNTTLGSALFNISDRGEATFMNSVNSTAAFQVQDASADSILSVSTIGTGQITISPLVNSYGDEFNISTLDSKWTFSKGSSGAGNTYDVNTTTAGNFHFTADGTTNHDCSGATVNCLRIIEVGPSSDFTATTKLNTIPPNGSGNYNFLGILAYQDGSNYMNFVLESDGSTSTQWRMAIEKTIGGSATTTSGCTGLTSLTAPFYVRVSRVGNVWTLYKSTDNLSYTSCANVTQTLTINSAGKGIGIVHDVLYGTGSGFTGSDFDWFHVDTGGTPTPVLNVTGAALYQNSADSTSAFQIQNSAGANIVNVDTTGSLTSSNLVANPSFETTISGSGAGVWVIKQGGAGTPTIANNTSQFYNQLNSAKVVTTANANDGIKQQLNTTLTASTAYNVIFYAKLDVASAAMATLQAGYSSTGASDDQVCSLSLTITPTGWTKYICTFTTGSSPTSSNYFFIRQSDGVIHTFYVDAVLLQLASSADANYRDAKIQVNGTITSSIAIQNASNSSNAFLVQNADGGQIFNVDTTDSNLLNNPANPSFEVNTAGWTTVVNGGTVTAGRDTSQQKYGIASLLVTTTAQTAQGARYTLASGNWPAGSYTVSFSMLNSGTAFGAIPILKFGNGSDNACSAATLINGAAGTIPSTTAWTRYAAACTFSGTTTSIAIEQNEATAHTFYIDAVQLETGAAATAYGLGAISLSGQIVSPVTFKNQSNSNTAFQIQNSSGTVLFGADSQNNAIQIGSSNTDSTAIFLVLDSYSTAADPTAPANGAMYYNTNTNSFRCRQNSIWRNCIESPSNASTADQAVGASATAYLTGSAITVPQGSVRVGTQFVWRISVSKTNAGLVGTKYSLMVGSNGSIADTARIAFTAANAETAAVDTAQVTIVCTVRSVSATGTWAGSFTINGHSAAAAAGFNNQASNVTSGTFDDTALSGQFVGLEVITGAAESLTFQQVQANSFNL